MRDLEGVCGPGVEASATCICSSWGLVESTWGSLDRRRGRSTVSRGLHCGFSWSRQLGRAISQVAGDPLLRLGASAHGDEVSGMSVA